MDKTATLLTLKSALRSSSSTTPKPMLLAAVNGKLQQQQQKRDLHRTSGKDGKSRRQQHKARSSTSPEGHHSQVPSKYIFFKLLLHYLIRKFLPQTFSISTSGSASPRAGALSPPQWCPPEQRGLSGIPLFKRAALFRKNVALCDSDGVYLYEDIYHRSEQML